MYPVVIEGEGEHKTTMNDHEGEGSRNDHQRGHVDRAIFRRVFYTCILNLSSYSYPIIKKYSNICEKIANELLRFGKSLIYTMIG